MSTAFPCRASAGEHKWSIMHIEMRPSNFSVVSHFMKSAVMHSTPGTPRWFTSSAIARDNVTPTARFTRRTRHLGQGTFVHAQSNLFE
jgi:hypothetical protein